MSKPYFPPLTVDGQLVDFAHLEPFKFTVRTQHRPEGASIGVRFSNHCFTDKFDAAIHGPNAVEVWDRGQRRVFSQDRYAQSYRLRGVVEGLPAANVFYTPEANFVRILPPFGQAGQEYRVYFSIRRDRFKDCDIILFVESAYSPDQTNPRLKSARMTKVRFALLVDKTLRDERLSFHYKR